MNRRNIFALAATGGMLAACGTLTASQLDTDAEGVADAVSTMAVALEAVVPAAEDTVLNDIEAAAKTAGQNATALNGLLPTGNNQSLVQGIVNAVEAFDPLIAQYFPVTAPIVMVLNAALSLLPALLADVGLPVPAAGRMRGPMFTAPLGRAYISSHVHPRTSAHR